MDHRAGVKIWAARLGAGEGRVRVGDIRFADEDESDGEDVPERHEEEEEGEEEEEPQLQVPVKRGRGRPRKKRGKANESPKGKGKAVVKAPQPEGELQVRLNGVEISPAEEGAWEFELPVGLSVVEVGAKGGVIWRAYLDRIVQV